MDNRDEIIAKLTMMAGFFEARADMAIGDGKMLLLSWVNAALDAANMIKTMPAEAPARRCATCKHCYDPIDTMDHYSGSDGSFFCGKMEIDFIAPEYDARTWFCGDWKPREAKA